MRFYGRSHLGRKSCHRRTFDRHAQATVIWRNQCPSDRGLKSSLLLAPASRYLVMVSPRMKLAERSGCLRSRIFGPGGLTISGAKEPTGVAPTSTARSWDRCGCWGSRRVFQRRRSGGSGTFTRSRAAVGTEGWMTS
jgi:hypothetical protein